jgi:hypothetical protein
LSKLTVSDEQSERGGYSTAAATAVAKPEMKLERRDE